MDKFTPQFDLREKALTLASVTQDAPALVVQRAEAYLAFLKGSTNSEKDIPYDTPKAEKKTAKRTTAADRAATRDALTESVNDDDLAELISESPKPVVTGTKTFDDVKMATLNLRDQVNTAAVKEVLVSYGANTIQDLTDIQYDGYVRSCEARIKNEPKPVKVEEDIGV